METLQLYRIAASMPWAQFDCTDSGNLRIVVWNGAQEDAPETRLCFNKAEAERFVKAMSVMIDNYMN